MRRSGEGGQIKLILDGLNVDKGTIPVPELLYRLGKLQDLIFTAGEYVLEEPFKDSGGRRPTRVTQKCTLIFKAIEAGSTELVAEIPDCQRTITESGLPFGIQAVDIIRQTMDAVEEYDNPVDAVNGFIDDPGYRSKIARQLDNMIPADDSGIKVYLELGDGKKRPLNPIYRPRVEKLLLGHEVGEETKVSGAIAKLKLTGERSIELWTTKKRNFKCSFEPELLEQIAELAGRLAFVEVKGIAAKKLGGEIVGIKEISSIVEASEMNINKISWRDSAIQLKHPLKVNVDVNLAEEMWTISNDELGISSLGKDYDSAMDAFQEEFVMLVEEYANESDDNLTEDAQELKQKIRRFLKE